MENAEIVAQWSCVDFPRPAPEARLSYLNALLDECNLLQWRLDREQLLVVGFAGLRWTDPMAAHDWHAGLSATACKQSPMASLLGAEIDATLKDLLRLGYASQQISRQIGRDHFAFGSML